MNDAENISQTPDAPSAVLPVSCLACGYDLRGLGGAGACPECGRKIDESRSRGTLRRAGAIWLTHFSTYLTFLACVWLVLTGAYCVSVYRIERVNIFTSLPQLKLPAWYSYALAAVSAIACVLVWLVTKAPPLQAEQADEDSMRMWIRFIAVCGALVAGFIDTDVARLPADALRAWSVCANLFAVAGTWLFWTYLGRCVDRIPDERLVRRCNAVKWGRTVGVVLGPLLGTLIHRQVVFTAGFRIFAPMPGRICLIAYDLIGFVLIIRIARRVTQLKALPIVPS